MTRELDSSELAAASAFIARRQDQIVKAICQLVEIESPSGDAHGSRAAVALLEKAARSIPSVNSVERIASPDYGEHLLIRAFCGDASGVAAKGDGATLLLGHTDTVHPRGTLNAPHGLRAEGDRLYGPGVFDMKAACVLAVEVLRCLTALALHPQRPVTLLLTCDEETGSATGRPLVEREMRRAAQVLVLEPPAPGGCVKTARKGVGAWTVAAHGIASHAGLTPEAGASAILELARQAEWLHSLNDPQRGPSFNVGTMRGGTQGNVVAAYAEMQVDVRFSTMAEARYVEDLMSALRPFDGRVRLTIKGGINRAPLERTAGVVKLFHHAREIAARLGFDLEERAVGGASDGNFAAALGVPVLDGLGVDGDGAHAAHEHIRVSDIVRRAALLAGLVATL
ncbi:MAG TPA: M20 family metallopeptidase [Blastocatellia bacterium]|nr:M20 family metallopeptidase [Blastocatellia bacterium]